jgi:hypothetical protein
MRRPVPWSADIYEIDQMLKYAGELCIGDIWTERTSGRNTHSYRVIATAPGPGPITINVTGLSVITGRRRTMEFCVINRVHVGEEPAESACDPVTDACG